VAVCTRGYANAMEKQELIERLAQLHTELSQAEQVDPEALALLDKLTEDIRRTEGELTAAPEAEDEDSITSGLRELLLKFEAEHPQLASAVGKVADALSSLGI